MKPAPFRYYRARSLEEAIELLCGPAAGGKVLAGGQSLVPLLNLRLARPEALVDLNPVRALAYIRREGDEIAIGSMTRHRQLEFSSAIARELPLLAEAVPEIGHPAIRNRGTLGGSLAHADPAAELPCVLTALGAELVAVGPKGERRLKAGDFFLASYTTALEENEVLKEVRVPALRPAGWAFVEFSRRHGDFALAEAAVALFPAAGRCEPRLVLGASVERPLGAASAEELLRRELDPQKEPGEEILAEVERLAAADLLGSGALREESEYLVHLTAVLARRAVAAAAARWRGA
jgi:carbon-monoxide dehydrogenase medium subunit